MNTIVKDAEYIDKKTICILNGYGRKTTIDTVLERASLVAGGARNVRT